MESFRSKVVTIYDTVSSVQWDASHGREPVKEGGGGLRLNTRELWVTKSRL